MPWTAIFRIMLPGNGLPYFTYGSIISAFHVPGYYLEYCSGAFNSLFGLESYIFRILPMSEYWALYYASIWKTAFWKTLDLLLHDCVLCFSPDFYVDHSKFLDCYQLRDCCSFETGWIISTYFFNNIWHEYVYTFYSNMFRCKYYTYLLIFQLCLVATIRSS